MRFWLIFLIILFGLGQVASAEKRAFIVGVGDYEELTDLQKTIGDATGYSEVFETDLGFQVTRLLDPTLEEFLDAFDIFAASIEPGDEVAFIFSGHGWSDGGDNFLALKDAPQQTSERMLKRATVSLSETVLDDLKGRKPGILFTIIDACRDNPFDLGTRTMTRGLVRQEMVQGTLVVYAAGARQKALDRLSPDDPSPYSVFTRSLLPKLRDPGRPLMRSVDEARNEVAALATGVGHQQRPAIYSDISLDFCFAGACKTDAPDLDQETQDWIYLSSGSYTAIDPCTKYQRHLDTYPDGKFAEVARRNLANPPCAAGARNLPSEIIAAQEDNLNWRGVDPENLLLFTTSNGRVLIEMFPDLAPKHVAQMKQIVRAGHLDNVDFHRVVQAFVVQSGDVRTAHSVDYPKLPAEFYQTKPFDQDAQQMIENERPFGEGLQEGYLSGMPIRWVITDKDPDLEAFWPVDQKITFWPMNCPGTVFSARMTDLDTAETQFFINIRWAEHQDLTDFDNLSRVNTGWGRILDGMDVIETLEIGHPPENPDRIVTARIAADMEDPDRPIAYVQRATGPDYQNFVRHSSGVRICERRPVPSRVAY
ncbi:MAG: peptidylprolyl isomerase [Hyphomonadaceae bacterium]|nr:peptidylprolyl isomerase [Hyphomonadaceae bacterium]